MKDLLQEKKILYRVVVQKNPEAYAELYDRYVEKIYRFVYYKVRSKEEAEDLVSDIFLKCWNYLISQPKAGISSFSGLIYKIARNAIVDVYRNKARNQEYPLEMGFDIPDTSAIEKLETHLEIEQVLKLIQKLKHEYQEVILLKYVEELSIGEIARILEKSQTSVRVILHRATKKLKELANK